MRWRSNKGFTLAEALVASTISAFVALVAVGALRTVTDSAEVVNQSGETTSEVAFAARMLAHDLANLYRDPDPRNMQLVGASQGAESSETAYLRLYTVGRAPARIGQPEGDVYEVEYLLRQAELPEAGSDDEAGISVLFRRQWPNPDREREPGGVLIPIARNIDVFGIRFFDGEQWVDEWSEELQSLPRLIEVTLATLGEEGAVATMETFTAYPARLANAMRAAAEAQSESGQPSSREAVQPAQGNGGPNSSR
jgi:general secretion pathway protein J